MAPVSLQRSRAASAGPQLRPNAGFTDDLYFDGLEADSDRPEVQEIIRNAIRRGSIRVVPVSGREDRVRIVRVPG